MRRLIRYSPPDWAKILRNIPEYYVKLCQHNTPINRWTFPGIPEQFKLSIKRDDMTGSALSGNKVRKLEFILADAVSNQCDTVITCGGIQSNHCRATAIASRQLGMQSYLLLRASMEEKEEQLNCGNILLDRMVGSKVILIPKRSQYLVSIKPRMEKMADYLRKQGSKPYLIPIGGSNHVGLFGYITAFQELMNQNIFEKFDDIVIAIGSGGAAAGIAIGNYLTGSKLRCHAFAVSDNNSYFYNHIDQALQECGLDIEPREIINVIDDYTGRGYAKSTEEELEFILQVTLESGIMFDRVYTGKAVRGMTIEMQKNPKRFKGSRILFVHTGGIFGIFDGEFNSILGKNSATNQITTWKNTDDPVPVF